MATRRKSIKLFEHERAVLVDFYLVKSIALEEYERSPEDLFDLTTQFNEATGRSETADGLFHYMMTQRKRGLWVSLDGKHRPATPLVELSAEETEILVTLYRENVAACGAGSDNLAFDLEIAELLAKEFFDATGRTLHPHQLVAKVIALRKRGLLPKVTKPPLKPPGYDDIDLAE